MLLFKDETHAINPLNLATSSTMSRNESFHSESREPLRAHQSLELQQDRISGPFSFLNPTRAAFEHKYPKEWTSGYADAAGKDPNAKGSVSEQVAGREDEQLASNIEFKWRSRDNRKGRHTLVADPTFDPAAPYIVPQKTTSLRAIAKGILRMATQFPYWDVSWLVAVIFTLGSCVWVINAFLVFLPLVQPSTDFHNEILVGGGVSAFIGATIFEIGSLLLMIEAMNENRSGCFGWALERVITGGETGRGFIRVRPDKARCVHHHTNKGNFVGKGSVEEPHESAIDVPRKAAEEEAAADQPFIWWPSVHDLRTHYLKELGFLASLAQLCGASIFWVALAHATGS